MCSCVHVIFFDTVYQRISGTGAQNDYDNSRIHIRRRKLVTDGIPSIFPSIKTDGKIGRKIRLRRKTVIDSYVTENHNEFFSLALV